tara:strand:- start:12458 stop:12814 length:357 start_codon:yes stop_codon:yes gene_type:complete
MKSFTIVLAFLFVGLAAQAQYLEVVKQEFYPNGNLKMECISVTAGAVEVTYFYESGVVSETGYFKQDQLEGEWSSYDENAQLLATGFFEEGHKTGMWKIYREGKLFYNLDYSSDLALK